jgi:hypothetical protein
MGRCGCGIEGIEKVEVVAVFLVSLGREVVDDGARLREVVMSGWKGRRVLLGFFN